MILIIAALTDDDLARQDRLKEVLQEMERPYALVYQSSEPVQHLVLSKYDPVMEATMLSKKMTQLFAEKGMI